jgi:trigger factor
MKVTNTADLAPTKKKLTLQIEPGDLATEREEAYEELGKEAVIPGFRKGHVPRQFLEYRFDKTIRKEAFGEALEKAIRDAAKEQDLRFVGSPSIDEEEQLESIAEKATEEPVEINVTLEYVPPFELPEYKGLKFTLPEFHVTDAMVNAEIESHREAAAYYVAVDDRPSKEGDFLIVGIETTRDGKPFEPLTRQRLMVSNLGRESDLQGFDEGLLGKAKGEKFEIEFEVPQGHPLHEEGGVNTFKAAGKVHQISERLLPDLDDELAKDRGFKDLDEYRSRVRKALESRRDALMHVRKEQTVRDFLLGKAEITVPSAMIQANYLSLKHARRLRELEEGGGDQYIPAGERSRAEMDTMFQAEQNAKERLLLHKIAETENLTVSDDEYYKRMANVARSRGEKNLDKFLADIDKHGMEDSYREDILMDKALHWLSENNQFETSPEPEGA